MFEHIYVKKSLLSLYKYLLHDPMQKKNEVPSGYPEQES